MKYSRTAIGLLTAQYRSVLKKCLLINLGLYALGAVAATPANAEIDDVSTLYGTYGTAQIFNETDGGGSMFTSKAEYGGVTSYVGVHDAHTAGIGSAAQIYVKDSSGTGAVLDITKNGMYFTVGNANFTDRTVAANQVATAASVATQIDNAVTNNGALKTALDAKLTGTSAAYTNGTTPADGDYYTASSIYQSLVKADSALQAANITGSTAEGADNTHVYSVTKANELLAAKQNTVSLGNGLQFGTGTDAAKISLKLATTNSGLVADENGLAVSGIEAANLGTTLTSTISGKLTGTGLTNYTTSPADNTYYTAAAVNTNFATKENATFTGTTTVAGLKFAGDNVATGITKTSAEDANALSLATAGYAVEQAKSYADNVVSADSGVITFKTSADATEAETYTKDVIGTGYDTTNTVKAAIDSKMATNDWTLSTDHAKLDGAKLGAGTVALAAIDPNAVLTSAELATATIDDNQLVTAKAVSDSITSLFNAKQDWMSEVLGYDTAQSIASQLTQLGFVAESGKLGFLQAVAQNRELFEAKDNAGAKYTVVESIQNALNNQEQDISVRSVNTQSLKVAIPAAGTAAENVILTAGVDDQGKNVIALNGATTVEGGLTADTLTLGTTTVAAGGIKDAVEENASGDTKNYLVTSNAVNSAFNTKVGKLADGQGATRSVADVLGVNADTGVLSFAEETGVTNIASGDGTKSAPTTIVGAIENLSYALGKIHGLASNDGTAGVIVGNNNSKFKAGDIANPFDSSKKIASSLPTGTSVEDIAVALDNAIGNIQDGTIIAGKAYADQQDRLIDETYAEDSKVVHNTGDETIDGQKTFVQAIVAEKGMDIGTGTSKYKINLSGSNLAIRDANTKQALALLSKTGFALNTLNAENETVNYFNANDKGMVLSANGNKYLSTSATAFNLYDTAGEPTFVVDNATGNVEAEGTVESTGLILGGKTATAFSADIDGAANNNVLATEAYADTKISKDDIVTDWSAVKDSTGTADTKVASEKLVYTSLHGTGTNDGTTVTPAGTVKLGDLAATTQVGTAENNLTVDHANNQVTIKAGDTAVLTAKATGIEVAGDVKATTLTLPNAAGTDTVVANGIKTVVEANTTAEGTNNYLVTSAAVYAKTGDANFVAGNYIEAGDNLTQAAQHLDTKVFADIHGTGTTTTPDGKVTIGDLANNTEIGNSKYMVRVNTNQQQTVFNYGKEDKVIIKGDTITAKNADTSSVYGAASMILNGSHAVTGIDPAKTATPTEDEKILATKGTVKGAIEDLLKSNNVWTGTNEFQKTLTVTYDDGGTQKEILKAGLNGSVPEVVISGRLILNDTLQFGTDASAVKASGIDTIVTKDNNAKLITSGAVYNAIHGTGASGETIYIGDNAEKVQIGKNGYNMTIDTENGKTVISDGSSAGTVTMDHGKLSAGTSVTAGSVNATTGAVTSGVQMSYDGTITSTNGTKVATVKYDGITLSENGTAAGNVFTVDEHGSMTAGKTTDKGQFVLDTQQGTADITTTKGGKTAGFGANGEVANIEASDGDYDYVVSADAKNGDVFVGLTEADSDKMLSGMQADDKGVGLGTFDNEELNTGIVVDKTDQTVTLAASGQEVVEISYDETDGGLVDVTGTVSATKGFVVPGATDTDPDVFSVDETGKTTTTTLAFTGDNGTNIVEAIDNGTVDQKLNTDGTFKDGQQTTMATVATVLHNAANGAYTAGDQSSWRNPYATGGTDTKPTTIADALDRLATNLDAATNDLGDWSKLSDHVNATGYAGNIDKTTGETPYSKPSAVSAIIDLDNAIGNRALYNAATTHYANNGTVAEEPIQVSQAIANMDTKVFQDIHGTGTTTTPGGDVKIGDLANTTTVGSAASNMTVNTTDAENPANNTIKFNINSNEVLGIDKDGIDVTGNITATNDISAGHSVYVGDPAGQITAMYDTGIVSVKDGTHQATFGNGGAWVQNGDAQAGLSGTGMWAENGTNKANVSNTGLWVETSATQNTSVGAGGMFTQNGNNNTGVGPDGVYTTDGTDHSSMGATGFYTTKDVTAKGNLSADNAGFTVTHDADKDQTQVTVAGDVDTQSLTMADATSTAAEPVKATVTAIDTAKAVQDLDLSGDEPAFRDGQTTTLATVATVLNDAENAKYNPIADLTADGTDYATADSQTINGAIADIDKRIGDFAQLHKDTADPTKLSKNLTYNGTIPATGDSTVVDMFNGIDSTLGTIHGLAESLGDAYKGNLDDGDTSSVEKHLAAIDTAIGDRRDYTARYNIENNQSVAESLDAMDLRMGDVASLGREMHYYSDPNPASVNLSSAVKSLDSNLYRLEMDHKKLRHETHAGLASAAALSALVPNPRGTGDTTLSFGTGAYQGHTAAAFGGFHWITNNLLVNAGVGWDNREATTRIGVSYSF